MHASRWDTSLVETAIYYVLRSGAKVRTDRGILEEGKGRGRFNAEGAEEECRGRREERTTSEGVAYKEKR
jgi:hypothetical protein